MKIAGLVALSTSNVASVLQALVRLSYDGRIVERPADLESVTHLILPGVGAFRTAMQELDARGLIEPLRRVVAAGKPLLGICLGMQLLAEQGEEGGVSDGLGLIAGRVRRLDPEDPSCRVPHVGWNQVRFVRPSPLWRRLDDGTDFYFVHEYVFESRDGKDIAGTVTHGKPFTAALSRDHVHGVQFHPEKSQNAGLKIFRNFMEAVA